MGWRDMTGGRTEVKVEIVLQIRTSHSRQTYNHSQLNYFLQGQVIVLSQDACFRAQALGLRQDAHFRFRAMICFRAYVLTQTKIFASEPYTHFRAQFGTWCSLQGPRTRDAPRPLKTFHSVKCKLFETGLLHLPPCSPPWSAKLMPSSLKKNLNKIKSVY